MDLITSRLDLQFGSFPEPVIFLAGGQAVYSNEPGQQLLQSETCPLDLLAALAEHPSGSMEIALGQATYRVTVSAASDRERDGNTALLSSLTPILLRGVPMGERTLHPLELKTEGETLTFTVELCVPLAQPEKPAMEPPGRMATLNLDI